MNRRGFLKGAALSAIGGLLGIGPKIDNGPETIPEDLVGLIVSWNGRGETYWVDRENGNDTNSGLTPGDAFRTIAKADVAFDLKDRARHFFPVPEPSPMVASMVVEETGDEVFRLYCRCNWQSQAF